MKKGKEGNLLLYYDELIIPLHHLTLLNLRLAGAAGLSWSESMLLSKLFLDKRSTAEISVGEKIWGPAGVRIGHNTAWLISGVPKSQCYRNVQVKLHIMSSLLSHNEIAFILTVI